MTDVAPAAGAPPPERGHGRIAEWIRRYGPAEIAGAFTALAGSYLAYTLTGNEIAAAYGGSLGENLGFYGVIVGREIRAERRAHRQRGTTYGVREWTWTATHLLVEFGVAELLDSTLVRPLAMGVATHDLGRTYGVLAGKLAADVIFYIPVIVIYEMRRGSRRSP
jgi:hypothetical protein